MKMNPPQIPKRFQPAGISILHEDLDLLVGNKQAGFLTVAALWEKDKTVHEALNIYLQKGNPRSRKSAFVVHRLDQGTSGVIVFAKSEQVQQFLKNDWPQTVKNYYAIVQGRLSKKSGLIESLLLEDEDYVVHTTTDPEKGKWARTEYTVVHESEHHSVVKINLLTGKKNQIRVHFAEMGHPVVGDTKYGKKEIKERPLMLHSFSIVLSHPFSKERVRFQAPVPEYFQKLAPYSY